MTEKPKEKKSELAMMKTDIVDVVTARISSLVDHGKLQLPTDYSEHNALMAAWLKLQSTKDKDGKLALKVCTHDSIANALLDMIVQGLTPARDQCYFVVYGTQLVMIRSYFGDEALLRRVRPGARVYAEPIYKGDELEYEILDGKKRITKHKQKFSNIGGLDTILGAYAVVEQEKFEPSCAVMIPHCEIMTLEQIKKAWSRGKNWPPKQGKQSPHTDHPEEFVKKTVLARACKRLINASDDKYLVKAVERQELLAAESDLKERAELEGDKQTIDIEPTPDPPAATGAHMSRGHEPEPEEPGASYLEKKSESPSSPSARWGDFIDEHKLDPTKARKLAASIRKLKDVRNLGNEDYEVILNDASRFLAYYRQQYSSGQPKLDGIDPKAGF